MTRKKRLTIIFSIIGLILVIGLVAYALLQTNGQESDPQTPTYSQLTGVEVSDEDAARPILGVIIENSREARPQTGLADAGIVFESVTEGGITRYLALYQEDQPEVVGPVRSLRPHFLDWAMGFDASIAHVGGSPEALELADERDARSLNQFNFSEPYYRVDDREAPHNMYARTADLRPLQEQENHGTADFTDIPRKSDAPAQTPDAERITLDFSSPTYQVEFRYDAANNTYARYLAGEPHIDAETNQPITVKNVVAIKADREEARVKSTGSGEAYIFTDGTVRTLQWNLQDFNNRIEFIDEQGNEAGLNRGKIWIAVLPSDREVSY